MGKKLFDPTPEQKKAGLEHVLFEMERLVGSAGTLGHISDQKSVEAQVLFEILLLHGRVLLEFFERGTRSNHGKNADILSSDFGFPTKDVHLERSTRNRLNKELAHLTYERTGNEWQVGPLLVPLMKRCLEFAEIVVSGPLRALIDGDQKQLERWSQVRDVLRGSTQVEAPSP